MPLPAPVLHRPAPQMTPRYQLRGGRGLFSLLPCQSAVLLPVPVHLLGSTKDSSRVFTPTQPIDVRLRRRGGRPRSRRSTAVRQTGVRGRTIVHHTAVAGRPWIPGRAATVLVVVVDVAS